MDIAGGGSERRIRKWCSSSSRKEGVMEEAMHIEGKKARGEGREQVLSMDGKVLFFGQII